MITNTITAFAESAPRTVSASRRTAIARPRALALAVAILLQAVCAIADPVGCHATAVWDSIPAAGPSPRAEYGFAYDSADSVAVLFGGSSNLSFAAVNSETWTWNGAAWTLADTAGMPRRCDNAFAYDAAKDRIVSFGGYDGVYLGDTWVREGGAWRQLVIPGPVARADAFMAYDSARGVMVLFGGQVASGTIRRDTWEFSDSTWTQRASGGPPAARWIQRMAYDSARGVTVMFGGLSPTGLLADTWEWNGTTGTWTETVIPGPPARYGHAMAYDPVNGVVALFGGQSSSFFGQDPLGDTWIYDGISWTQLAISGPSPRTFVKMVYDASRARLVLFSGYDGTSMVSDTWELDLASATGVPGWADGRGAHDGASTDRAQWVLRGSAPNPFADSAEIRFVLDAPSRVEVDVYDASGAFVRRLVDAPHAAGSHAVTWDGRSAGGSAAASGRYLIRLRSGEHVESREIVLMR